DARVVMRQTADAVLRQALPGAIGRRPERRATALPRNDLCGQVEDRHGYFLSPSARRRAATYKCALRAALIQDRTVVFKRGIPFSEAGRAADAPSSWIGGPDREPHRAGCATRPPPGLAETAFGVPRQSSVASAARPTVDSARSSQ